MDEIITNWVLLIDCTEIMALKDFKPSRFHVALKGAQKFIQMKFKYFPEEFLSVYLFSDKTQILSQLSRNSRDILQQLLSSKFLKSHKPHGDGEELFFALQHAVEMIRAQIQQIGGQRSRIILITGQPSFSNTKDMENLIKLIKGLDIFLDIFLFSAKSDSQKANYIPLMDQIHGNLFEFTSRREFYGELIKYSKQDDLLAGASQINLNSDQDRSESLIEIAQNLRRPTAQELAKIKDRLSMVRCQICFQKKSPINHKSLAITGRYCPHCNTPLHIHCAGVWTDKTDEGANLFRCPYCYTLLKVPMFILKGIRSQNQLKGAKDPGRFVVKLIREKGHPNRLKDQECAYCFKPFDLDHGGKIYRCSYCNGLYHEACLKAMYKKHKTCQNCGRKIV